MNTTEAPFDLAYEPYKQDEIKFDLSKLEIYDIIVNYNSRCN